MRVFVAGATGAVGRPLVRRLLDAGHEVVGMTRTAAKRRWLEEQGAAAVLLDALDTDATRRAVIEAEPEIVIDQLTDLPKEMSPFRFRHFYDRQIGLKRAAPQALLEGALEAGARRHIMQSIAFMYAPTGEIHGEEDPVYLDAPRPWDEAIPPFPQIEERIVGQRELEGVVLRYGYFYGPGTHFAPDGAICSQVRKRQFPIVGDGGGVYSFIHVDDAAEAALRATEAGAAGIYNIVDDTPLPVRDWLPAYAAAVGAEPPRRVPRWLARLTVGPIPTHLSTTLDGASNRRAREVLGWTPEIPDPRLGFTAAGGA